MAFKTRFQPLTHRFSASIPQWFYIEDTGFFFSAFFIPVFIMCASASEPSVPANQTSFHHTNLIVLETGECGTTRGTIAEIHI